LVFEYVDRNLLEILEEKTTGIPEDLIKKYMYQIVKAVEICHRNEIIHRDIKPENLLVSINHKVKLCDFGFSRTMPQSKNGMTDYVATRWYRPPELLLGSSTYGKDIDIWAIG
jgi:cyclin-dependent kinase-like